MSTQRNMRSYNSLTHYFDFQMIKKSEWQAITQSLIPLFHSIYDFYRFNLFILKTSCQRYLILSAKTNFPGRFRHTPIYFPFSLHFKIIKKSFRSTRLIFKIEPIYINKIQVQTLNSGGIFFFFCIFFYIHTFCYV